MNISEPPTHIGGYQHLQADVICKDGDIYVLDGRPVAFVDAYIDSYVGAAERKTGMNIYRKYPVAKQGDNDDTGWKKVRQQAADEPAMHSGPLPADAAKRKAIPIYSGCIAYFPDAIAAVARLSQVGNEQHNPGKPLHWDRSKSGDEADALMRHLLQKDEVDKDGVPHAVKVAWRGLALAQKYLEAKRGA